MKRKSSQARRAEIIEVSLRLLATRGARQFTAETIATELDLTAGALFRHFDTMESIVEAMVEEIEQLLLANLMQDEGPPWESLEKFFYRRLQLLLDHPHISHLLLSDQLREAAGAKTATRIQKIKRRSQGFVRECLKQAAASGQLQAHASVEAATVLVVGALRAIAHRQPPWSRQRTTALAQEVWAALQRGLAVPSKRKPI